MVNCLFEKGEYSECIKQLGLIKNIKSGITADLECTNEFIEDLINKVTLITKEQLCHTM
jgi:hypothetical protein